MGEKKKQAHQALYRKYRSKSLKEVIGQEHITKTLAQALKRGKINHAYLFTGPRGVGKTSVARILAHQINGLPYSDEAPNLDIIEIDAASNRRIDDIRDLRDKVHIAPVAAKYKVYIIDEVHMLTPESFNALLKTLEEPPAHIVFILATTEVHKLPATIISRTQRHSFRTIPEQKVAAHLKQIAKDEQITIDDQALALLAKHGEGSFRDSISLLDQFSASNEPITTKQVELLLGLAPEAQLKTLLEAVQSGDSKLVITQLESLYEAGLTPPAIAQQLLAVLHQSVKETGNAGALHLMKQLLMVGSSAYPELALETSLLELAVQQNNSPKTPPIPHKPAANSKKPTPSKTIEAKVATKTKSFRQKPPVLAQKESAPAPSRAAFEALWPELLKAAKQKNNSLYTILRLAQYELRQGELILTFGFEFHQKRVNTAANKQLISELVEQLTGANVTISTNVTKQATPDLPELSMAPPDSATSDSAHASLIAQVQDMMGGGEVVNV